MSPLNTVQRNVLFETQLIPQQEPLYKLRKKPSNRRPEGPRRGSQVTERWSEVTKRGSQVTQRGSQVTGGTHRRLRGPAGCRGDGRDGDAARHLPCRRGAGLARSPSPRPRPASGRSAPGPSPGRGPAGPRWMWIRLSSVVVMLDFLPGAGCFSGVSLKTLRPGVPSRSSGGPDASSSTGAVLTERTETGERAPGLRSGDEALETVVMVTGEQRPPVDPGRGLVRRPARPPPSSSSRGSRTSWRPPARPPPRGGSAPARRAASAPAGGGCS